MSVQEQAPAKTHDGNPDYALHHPDAIQDEGRAKEIAVATKDFEEAVVEHANNVIQKMDSGLADKDDEMYVANELNAATKYREEADKISDPSFGKPNRDRVEDESSVHNPARLAKALKSGRKAPHSVIQRAEF